MKVKQTVESVVFACFLSSDLPVLVALFFYKQFLYIFIQMELKLRYFLVFNKPFLLLKEIREKLQYYLRQIFSNYYGLKTSNYCLQQCINSSSIHIHITINTLISLLANLLAVTTNITECNYCLVLSYNKTEQFGQSGLNSFQTSILFEEYSHFLIHPLSTQEHALFSLNAHCLKLSSKRYILHHTKELVSPHWMAFFEQKKKYLLVKMIGKAIQSSINS